MSRQFLDLFRADFEASTDSLLLVVPISVLKDVQTAMWRLVSPTKSMEILTPEIGNSKSGSFFRSVFSSWAWRQQGAFCQLAPPSRLP